MTDDEQVIIDMSNLSGLTMDRWNNYQEEVGENLISALEWDRINFKPERITYVIENYDRVVRKLKLEKLNK